MANRQPSMFQVYEPGISLMPEDFPQRLVQLRKATGLSWEGVATCLGVDSKQLRRWRGGAEPCGGAMLALCRFAVRVPGGLDLLLSEEFQSEGKRG